MNIGVLGGTFDPIHAGHLVVADEVSTRLGLDEVLFIPAGSPWLKADSAISPAEDRIEMVELAIAGNPRYKLSTLEIERTGPTYTIDTMRELRQKLNAGDELFFILGWDNLEDLPRWHRPRELAAVCRLVAVPRVGYPVPDLSLLEASIPGISQRVIVLDKPEIDISASVIRERVRQGLHISRLVPEPVERYIKQHGLYLGQ
jgi:nicotinate-nucleotide adenylyltransferase